MRRLLAAALCAMAKGQNSSCGPVRASYDHAGFGNAFDVLFVAFHWARRCNSRVEIVGDESDRLRRICERLTCAGANVVTNHTCHPGCPPPLMTWKQTPSSAYIETLEPSDSTARRPRSAKRRSAAPVDASVFAPAREYAWLSPLECRGPNAAARRAAGAAQPFPNAVHIRSIRYDFERPPATVAADMENRAHDSPSAGLAEDSAAGWARLAGQVQTRGQRGGDVYLASDNAPARNALAHHIAARNNVTACYVPRTPGHSSYHTARADDDHAMTDWWALANADAIIAADIKCMGKKAESCAALGQLFVGGSRRSPSASRRGRRFSSFSRTAHRLRPHGKQGRLVYVSV